MESYLNIQSIFQQSLRRNQPRIPVSLSGVILIYLSRVTPMSALYYIPNTLRSSSLSLTTTDERYTVYKRFKAPAMLQDLHNKRS